jgi:hypothetical protein
VYHDVFVHWIYDPSHFIKIGRNNLGYSRKEGTKRLLLDNVRLNRLVPFDWDKTLHEPYLWYERLTYPNRPQNGISNEIFDVVRNNRLKMETSKAAAINSNKCQQLFANIRTALAASGPLTDEKRIVIEGIEALAPLQKASNDFFDVCNGIDVEASSARGGKKRNIVKDRKGLSWDSVKEFEVLAQLPRIIQRNFDRVKDLEAEQKRARAALEVDPEDAAHTITAFRNSFTPTYRMGAANIAYGLKSFVTYYTSHLFDPALKVTVKPALVTTDHCELHFCNTKNRCCSLTVKNIQQADARGAAKKLVRLTRFFEYGKEATKRIGKISSKRKRGRGNVDHSDSSDGEDDDRDEQRLENLRAKSHRKNFGSNKQLVGTSMVDKLSRMN